MTSVIDGQMLCYNDCHNKISLMNSRQPDGRKRVVETTAEMLAQHGLNATSIRAIAKRAKAPLGSTYHHFPQGKQQVVVEAVTFAGEQVAASLDHHLQAGATVGIGGFLAMWRAILLRSDFRIGCPVLAVAVEEPIEEGAEEARKAAALAFGQWEEKLTTALIAEGRDPAAAAGLATLVVAGIEGATALCRASRNIGPLDRIADQLLGLISRT